MDGVGGWSLALRMSLIEHTGGIWLHLDGAGNDNEYM